MISIYVLSALTILAMTLSFFLFPTINIKGNDSFATHFVK